MTWAWHYCLPHLNVRACLAGSVNHGQDGGGEQHTMDIFKGAALGPGGPAVEQGVGQGSQLQKHALS